MGKIHHIQDQRLWIKSTYWGIGCTLIVVDTYIDISFQLKIYLNISSVIRQKGEYQNGCFKKTKNAKFSKKGTFLTA